MKDNLLLKTKGIEELYDGIEVNFVSPATNLVEAKEIAKELKE
ncbi:MAG: hypothetical protein AB1420_17580 [Bacillota bacterium]